MTIDVGKDAYSNYRGYKYNPYKLITHLINNNELIWNILNNNLPDAWNDSPLSYEEKISMIYSGSGHMADFKVFTDIGQDESFTGHKTLLRVTNYKLRPLNRTLGVSTHHRQE